MTYKGWTNEKRLWAIHWLLAIIALLQLITLLAVALIAAAPAHASTPEDTYLAALARHGIAGDPAALLGAGHDTCDAMAQGWVASGFLIWKPNGEYLGAGLSYPQTLQAERDAVNALCPDRSYWRN